MHWKNFAKIVKPHPPGQEKERLLDWINKGYVDIPPTILNKGPPREELYEKEKTPEE
jgi:hypothetical protein